MSWFSVKIAYASKISGSFKDGLAETRIFLFWAHDSIEATLKAKTLAEQGCTKYKNADEEEVVWVVTGIDEVHDLEVDELVDGIEVYSELQIPED